MRLIVYLLKLIYLMRIRPYHYRMMMLEEDQISFRSDSLMFDGVEDYSHQIAEMIGLRNESYLIQAGVSNCLIS